MCASMVDMQSATAEIRRGKKKEEERRINDRMKIYMARVAINKEKTNPTHIV